MRKIKSDESGRMNGENLLNQIKIDIESGLTPAFVAATLGTTGLCVGLFMEMLRNILFIADHNLFRSIA